MEPLVTTSLERSELKEHGFVWSNNRGRFIESHEGPFPEEVIRNAPERLDASDVMLDMLAELIKVTAETHRQNIGNGEVVAQAPPVIEVNPQIEIMLPSDLIHPQLQPPDGEEVTVLERDSEGFIVKLAKKFVKSSDKPEEAPSIRDQVRNSLGLST